MKLSDDQILLGKYKKQRRALRFRTAVAHNDLETIEAMGKDSWLNDVDYTTVDYSLIPKRSLVSSLHLLRHVAEGIRGINTTRTLVSFEKATHSKFISLGYKTYRHIVRSTYSKNADLIKLSTLFADIDNKYKTLREIVLREASGI